MGVSIAELPEGARPRERLWRLGAASLSDAELLALVIGAGSRGSSALSVATKLLGDWGGVGALALAEPEELAARTGIGHARAAAVAAALELVRRAQPAISQPVLSRQEDLAELAVRELRGRRRERLIAIVLGPGNRLRRVLTIADGGVEAAPCPVRDVLAAVLRNDGVAFAVAHNHPSGDATPSERDRVATERLVAGAGEVGLRFLDHVVVGDDGWRAVQLNRGSGGGFG